ncbi:hypothetical protein CRG98_045101 [Punica granatum]|uniref:BED-type domain-containing protein n=1 Tax=Punica granatum TaxID=22663 RepID=A0A2I0HS74_PUNGR|nr:hypothetical protein CRG98_045101 [Punica granatum]
MVRGRDACWEHCDLVDATKQKVRCNYCEREFSGGVYRMKFHLAQIKNKDIVPCTKVPSNVRNHIRSILSAPKKPKTPKKPKLDRAANGQQNSSSGSENSHANPNSSGQRGSSGSPVFIPQVSPDNPPATDDSQKLKQDHADKKVAMFFFHNAIPFRAAKSVYYQEMVDSIAECGTGYKAPSQEKLRTALLEKVRDDIHDCYRKYKEEWREFGCTILCESGPSVRTKSVLAFTVTYPKGSIFLKSVNVSGHEDDANYLFELLESVVLEVGIENVVQVITDSSASFIYAGSLLMAKYISLFCSPCASYCITKMLEDMSKQDWVVTVLEDAKTFIRYIHSNASTLNMTKKFYGGKELMRPGITRSVSDFLCLRAIVVHEENLKHIFSHNEWLSSIYSRHPDAQAFKSLLYSERFWRSAHEVVNVWEPLVKILRIVDGDMPAIGYLYEGIERAKIMIKLYYKAIEERYLPIWEIIDRRWSMQLRSPLYAAAASLNPSVFYCSNWKNDPRVRNGFQEVMLKVVSSDDEKRNITREHPVYINSQGALGTELAVMGRTLNAPGDWWAAYGYEIPTLQRMATRILSQPCSSHWCRWNWSTFESLHFKTRTKEFARGMEDVNLSSSMK